MYSRPQFLDGVPPLVSRCILETLIYLDRNHPNVSKLLLQLELPRSPARELHGFDQGRGKAVMVMEEDDKQHQKGDALIVMLLSLLNLPLYARSIAHLEQLQIYWKLSLIMLKVAPTRLNLPHLLMQIKNVTFTLYYLAYHNLLLHYIYIILPYVYGTYFNLYDRQN